MAVTAVADELGAEAPAEAPWRSPLAGLMRVRVSRQPESFVGAACPTCNAVAQPAAVLPASLRTALGPNAEEYEAFVVAYLPAGAASGAVKAARAARLPALADDPPTVALPWHRFAPGRPTDRHAAGYPPGLRALAIPGHYVVRFAYPIRSRWLSDLEACGASQVTMVGDATFLLRASGPRPLVSCSVARYLDVVEPWYSTDRIAPELAQVEGRNRYWLQFASDVDPVTAAASLPPAIEVLQTWQSPQDRFTHSKSRPRPPTSAGSSRRRPRFSR
jgi:hypothetical protein